MSAVLAGAPAAPQAQTPESFWISLRYFNLYRMAVATLFFAATLFYGDWLNLGSHALPQFRATSIAYLVLGVVFHGVLRNLRDRFELQLSIHVFADIVAIALLMNASGGLRSGLGVMLVISLIGAALVAPRRLNYLYAALAAIALLLEQSYWTLVHDLPTAHFLQPGLLAIGCFAGAGVTGWLAQRVATNEQLAERRGRELEMQTRVNQLVLEDMHDGVVVLDQAGRIVQHNPQARRLLGADQLRGRALATLLPGFEARWQQWHRGGLESVHQDLDFEVRGRGVRLRFLESGVGDELSVLFVEDLTRLRDQAQQLKLAALGRLTANLAHEIRNPLAAISHAGELLGEEKRERDRARLCRIIYDNTARLERLVSEVLQLNRRDRASPERIHLNDWILSFVESFVANERVAPERFVVEARNDCWVVFDAEHLHQVLWNLLRNAVRYSQHGAGSVRILMAQFGGLVELSVMDNGPGVERAAQNQLFEPFYTTDSKGIGLGLYLARELCSANQALLEYVHEPAGAHFRLRFRETAAG